MYTRFVRVCATRCDAALTTAPRYFIPRASLQFTGLSGVYFLKYISGAPGGTFATKVRFFGVKSANVPPGADGHLTR